MPDPPADLEQVRAAFRLGWAVAELRGRYRPDLFESPQPGIGDLPQRVDHALPLASERKNREVRIEVREAAEGLSVALGLEDPDVRDSEDSLLAPVREAFDELEDATGENRDERWTAVANAIYDWDAGNQDDLVVQAPRAAAYQLGRALAETYWALYPKRPANEMGSWEALFGTHRRQTIARLVARLSAYLGSSVVAAVNDPFAAWEQLAGSPARRELPEVLPALYQQGLLWRDLIRGERQAGDLLLPRALGADQPPAAKDVWGDLLLYREAVETLKGPLIAGGIGLVLLVGAAAGLASGTKVPGLTTAIGLLGLLGVTSASLYARAKAELTSLLTTLRLRVQRERVRRAANFCPPDPAAPPPPAPPPWWKWLLGKGGGA